MTWTCRPGCPRANAPSSARCSAAWKWSWSTPSMRSRPWKRKKPSARPPRPGSPSCTPASSPRSPMAEPAYTSTPTDDDVDAQSSDDEALLRTARARFERSVEAETELREQFAIDQRYRAGLQWPDHVQQE